MTPLQRRFKEAIQRLGDTLTVAGTPRKAVTVILGRNFAYTLIPAGDVDISTRPMRLAYVPFDDSSSAGNAASWDGLSYTVRKVVSARVQDQTVFKMLVLG